MMELNDYKQLWYVIYGFNFLNFYGGVYFFRVYDVLIKVEEIGDWKFVEKEILLLIYVINFVVKVLKLI